jgi:hypothetical protein
MKDKVCIQFTGGKDSTLLAALMAREYEKVFLLSFRNSMIVDLDKIPVNVGKLKNLMGEDKFEHTIMENEPLMRKIYSSHWRQDLQKYQSYSANNICGPCRLAMITHTIVYCLNHGIRAVRDGANRTGFDLSQQVWSLELIQAFYQEFGIDYDFALYKSSRNDIDLLKLGLAADPPIIFYRSQPLCKGGGEIHNIYLRCYFLPRFGREARREQDIQWLQDKLQICKEFIAENVVLPAADTKKTEANRLMISTEERS